MQAKHGELKRLVTDAYRHQEINAANYKAMVEPEVGDIPRRYRRSAPDADNALPQTTDEHR
jgi:hypothetical protein